MHYPTDSSLLSDGVRVLSRMLKRAQGVLTNAADLGKEVLRDRTRSAKAWSSASMAWGAAWIMAKMASDVGSVGA